MLLFQEELNAPAQPQERQPEMESKIVTVLFWFIPEKRFLCEKGVLMCRELPAAAAAQQPEELEKLQAYYSRSTRIKPVEVEFEGENIIVRGPKGTRIFNVRAIEDKERLRRKSLDFDSDSFS